jgi:integrase
MIDRGPSARTVRYTHSVLRSAMRQAIRWRLQAQDPTDGAQLPRLRRREMRVLDADQSRAFLSAALKTHYGPVFCSRSHHRHAPIGIPRVEMAGHRLGSRYCQCRAHLREVSRRSAFCGDEASAQPTHYQISGLGARNAQGSARQSDATDWKSRGKRRRAGLSPLVLVNPSIPTSLQKKFKATLRQAALPIIRLYDLRHTSATLALAAGVPPKVGANKCRA